MSRGAKSWQPGDGERILAPTIVRVEGLEAGSKEAEAILEQHKSRIAQFQLGMLRNWANGALDQQWTTREFEDCTLRGEVRFNQPMITLTPKLRPPPPVTRSPIDLVVLEWVFDDNTKEKGVEPYYYLAAQVPIQVAVVGPDSALYPGADPLNSWMYTLTGDGTFTWNGAGGSYVGFPIKVAGFVLDGITFVLQYFERDPEELKSPKPRDFVQFFGIAPDAEYWVWVSTSEERRYFTTLTNPFNRTNGAWSSGPDLEGPYQGYIKANRNQTSLDIVSVSPFITEDARNRALARENFSWDGYYGNTLYPAEWYRWYGWQVHNAHTLMPRIEMASGKGKSLQYVGVDEKPDPDDYPFVFESADAMMRYEEYNRCSPYSVETFDYARAAVADIRDFSAPAMPTIHGAILEVRNMRDVKKYGDILTFDVTAFWQAAYAYHNSLVSRGDRGVGTLSGPPPFLERNGFPPREWFPNPSTSTFVEEIEDFIKSSDPGTAWMDEPIPVTPADVTLRLTMVWGITSKDDWMAYVNSLQGDGVYTGPLPKSVVTRDIDRMTVTSRMQVQQRSYSPPDVLPWGNRFGKLVVEVSSGQVMFSRDPSRE